MAVDREASAVRRKALEALKLHKVGNHTEALARAVDLARDHPGSALALNLAGSLHRYAGIGAWINRPAGDEAAASALDSHHHNASLDAFSAAAKLAPNCLVTALSHAKALAACHRYGEAQAKLCVALTVTDTDQQDDPALHNVRYDLACGSTVKARKYDAMAEADTFMKHFANTICHRVIPREAVKLLDPNKLVGPAGHETRETAKLLARSYFYSGRAQLLRAYIDLAQVRALDLAADKKRLLRRTLDMVSQAAGTFHKSLVIALFHAKLLFVLDEPDAAERECRRALGIETPSDPNDDNLPPISVSGADFDARVSTVRRQLRVLLKQIIVVAAKFWCSMISAHQDEIIISVKVDTLHAYYDTFDQSAAKTISDGRRFVKKHNSWSFWVCPRPHCDGKKFLDADLLWQHMCSKHPEELWEKLQSILGPELCANASEDDHLLDGITLCQDSGQNDTFRLPRMQEMFESLLFRPSVGIIQAESIVGMRQRKCREASEILEIIKEKLRMLPEDILSTEGCRFGIQNLWLKFLENSVLDYREVILPLARSFQWMELNRVMAHALNVHARSIGDASIDAVFGKLLGARDMNVSVENGSIPSHTNNIDHQNGDNLQTDNLKPSHTDETLKADEKCEESEVHGEDWNSSTIVNQKSSGPPIEVHENGTTLSEGMAGWELDKNGTSGQSVEEKAGTSSYQPTVNVFNKNNSDNDLFILRLIIQTLCSLRHFRDKFLTEPLAWIPSVDNPCIAQIFHEILSAWEKNDHQLTTVLLTCVKIFLCGIVDGTSYYYKLQVGKNFASEVVANILIGLHMSETSWRSSFNKQTERHVVNPITCGDCICPTHNLFGIKFDVQMSCSCGNCSDDDEHIYTTLIHKLDTGSPQTTKIKSFAELPVLLDKQFCEDNCEHCGSPKNIDLFLSNRPHFFTIVLSWLGCSESQDTLSEVLAGIMSPIDTEFFCRSANCSTMYTVASMISYVDDRYVCFERSEDKWLIYDSKTVEIEDTWEHLLEHFKDCKLQPEVLFFEVIK